MATNNGGRLLDIWLLFKEVGCSVDALLEGRSASMGSGDSRDVIFSCKGTLFSSSKVSISESGEEGYSQPSLALTSMVSSSSVGGML